MTENTPPQLDPELLSLLRCPVALKETDDNAARLRVAHDGWWLVCDASGYKYPVRDGIPHMMIDEGAQWKDTDVDALPVPPPPESDE